MHPFVAGVAVEDHVVVRIEMLIELGEHLRSRRTERAMILEKGDRARAAERHRNGPMAKWPPANGGPVRLAADRVTVVGEAQPIQHRHETIVRLKAGRRESLRLAEVTHEMRV